MVTAKTPFSLGRDRKAAEARGGAVADPAVGELRAVLAGRARARAALAAHPARGARPARAAAHHALRQQREPGLP